MTTLLEIHERHFDVALGTFDKKPFAAMVAEQLRRFIAKEIAPTQFDSRSVNIEGKHSFLIEFPRVRHIWWPRGLTKEAIAAEYETVVGLFKEALK